jgi:2-keto-4-pentenoate hydratase/2-oxohepta-3-ene-1,7-dioic acid hydratase in catechol pathway
VTGPVPSLAELGPAVPRPRQIFAIGLNYVDHTRETGFKQPAEPVVFTKFQSSLAGPGGTIELKAARVDWEIELVVVIGRTGVRVKPESAWDHVAGLTIGQDLSDRDVQMAGDPPQFSLGKSFPGYGPIGPQVVTLDEIASPDDLEIICVINDETVQRGRTSSMVFPVPELVARLSAICILQPGDVIFTGTPPGVGMGRIPPRFLAPGDTIESSIEGLGHMRHEVVSGFVNEKAA